VRWDAEAVIIDKIVWLALLLLPLLCSAVSSVC
jgi:hypothetical protein